MVPNNNMYGNQYQSLPSYEGQTEQEIRADLARGLAQIQYNKQLAQNIQNGSIQNSTNQASVLNNALANLRVQNLINENNSIMQNKIIPAQQALASRVQNVYNGGNHNTINPLAQSAEEYQRNMARLGMGVEFGIPGAEARLQAYRDTNQRWVQNASLANGSTNPFAQAAGQRAVDSIRNQYAR